MTDWPTDPNAFRIVRDEPAQQPDADGRESFTLLWWQGDRPRAQCFFSNPTLTAISMCATGRKESP